MGKVDRYRLRDTLHFQFSNSLIQLIKHNIMQTNTYDNKSELAFFSLKSFKSQGTTIFSLYDENNKIQPILKSAILTTLRTFNFPAVGRNCSVIGGFGFSATDLSR
jgi:hypothetical protein